MGHGFIFSLEGIHGAGKSTLGPSLVNRLRRLNFGQRVCTDQTATETGRLVRQLNLKLLNELDPMTELFLVAAARREAFIEVAQPYLDQGQHVLTERFTDAFYAFGRVRGTPSHLLRVIAQSVSNGRIPDYTLLLDCPADIALARIPAAERHRVENE